MKKMAILFYLFTSPAMAMIEIDHRPEPVTGIQVTQEYQEYYVDLRHDLTQQTVNPLLNTQLNKALLFIDGDSMAQQQWAQQQLHNQPDALLVLTNGAPFTLSQAWQIPVYFDQGRLLSTQLGIHYVPARVTQSGTQLKIVHEVAL
jgi:hypothetical protein